MKVDVLTETVIAVPCERVAAYVADPSHAPEWYENISSVEWQTPPLVFCRPNGRPLGPHVVLDRTVYSHLTQHAACEAVDTIDCTFSTAEQTAVRPRRPAWLRPPPNARKAVLSRMRERPPTCVKHSRDDRI